MDLQWIWVFIKAFFAVIVDKIREVFEKKPPDIPPVAIYCYSCRLFNSDNYCEIEQYLNTMQDIAEVQIIPVNSTFVIVLVKRQIPPLL